MMEFLTNLTLGKKITVLTTLGLLVGVGVFSFFSMQAVNRATEAMLQDRLTTATLVADYLDEALERALAELQSVAQTIQATGERGRIEANVALLEDSFSRLSIRTHGIFLIDTEGKITWSQTKSPDMAKVNIASYPAFDQAINRTRANVSGLVSAPITSTPVILLTSPTIQEPGGSRGVLVVAVDLAQSSIGGFIQPIRLGQTGYVEIVDQNGMVVARTQPGPSLSPFEKSDHSGRFAALIDAAEPARGVCHTCHEPGKKVEKRDVLAFVPLSSARWGVVIRQSQEEALAPTRELRQNLLLFGVGLVTIALVFVGVTTRNIGGRIRALTSASRRIAEGDLFTPISTPGRDEVGMLGETLDDMRHKLMTSYSELEQKTRELSSLLSVSEILTSARDLPSLLNSVVAKAVEIIPGSDGGALLLQNPGQGGLAVQCAIGLEKAALEQLTATANNQSDTGVR
ncbi:MAG: HAMP domain-containing protein, partial [Chloroflexi bacterium]|nr:HAMP domain-containing protein [Chloroflexota bacterium]